MKLYHATNSDIERISRELEIAKKRDRSEDFLLGFPWESIMWYGAELEHGELENIFLFWDGSAWGESPHQLPRRLIHGVADFMRIENDPTQSNNVHLDQIKEWLNKYEAGDIRSNETFLILGGIDQNNSLIILDGNHRISAALWQATRSKDRSRLPRKAWIGLSPDMRCYVNYQRILQAP